MRCIRGIIPGCPNPTAVATHDAPSAVARQECSGPPTLKRGDRTEALAHAYPDSRGGEQERLTPVPGKCQEGVEYVWKAKGRTFRVRIHDPDPSVIPTATNPSPNALVGWVVRIKRGRHYMDSEGRFHPAGKLNPRSTEFDEFLGNETHIPILPPASYPGGGSDEHSD